MWKYMGQKRPGFAGVPNPAFEQIRNYISFYPAALICYVSGERVVAQPGQFYGGWVANEIVGTQKKSSTFLLHFPLAHRHRVDQFKNL